MDNDTHNFRRTAFLKRLVTAINRHTYIFEVYYIHKKTYIISFLLYSVFNEQRDFLEI